MLDCEWNILANRPLTLKEYNSGLAHAKATVLLGKEEQLAVCDECANLPELSKYKIRKHLEDAA